jgi:hypothetical protein
MVLIFDSRFIEGHQGHNEHNRQLRSATTPFDPATTPLEQDAEKVTRGGSTS